MLTPLPIRSNIFRENCLAGLRGSLDSGVAADLSTLAQNDPEDYLRAIWLFLEPKLGSEPTEVALYRLTSLLNFIHPLILRAGHDLKDGQRIDLVNFFVARWKHAQC